MEPTIVADTESDAEVRGPMGVGCWPVPIGGGVIVGEEELQLGRRVEAARAAAPEECADASD